MRDHKVCSYPMRLHGALQQPRIYFEYPNIGVVACVYRVAQGLHKAYVDRTKLTQQ